VILAPATAPALAAKRATATIPIVCPLLENPVGLGLVSSHNRPVGNVTGILRYVEGLAGKNLEVAHVIVAARYSRGPAGECRHLLALADEVIE
jgi:putative tryptophan/tyrosine transport system substrate-binding protein